MDYEDDASRELIKCVVVGDTGVGKTRLICAKACGQKLTLEQLINVHVPTVWAIDQYRICREVLERSFEVVDGINIALRIWDTFGDHHNDRCFAYGRSDVVLLCYSVASSRSLEHAKTVWYPEIRRQRPNVPVLLVGCKNDLRYLCLQPEFQRMLAQRRPSPLKCDRNQPEPGDPAGTAGSQATSAKGYELRPVHADDIVSPEQGRAAAKEIGAFYYETSVLTRFGVEETFQNAVRAALCRRRQGRLWSGHFQCVKLPQIQAPFLPLKPSVPSVKVLPSCYVEQMANLVSVQSTLPAGSADEMGSDGETYYDCLLRVDRQTFQAHKLILAASSKMFRDLFVCDTINCRLCVEKDESEECGRSDASRESLLIERNDTDLLLDDDDDDDNADVFCLPVLHRSNVSSGLCSLAVGKESNTKQHKRGRSADTANRNSSSSSTSVAKCASRNRHATVGAFLASNHSSSSRKSDVSSGKIVHARSTLAVNAHGFPDCVVSVTDDFRRRRRNNRVVIPVTTVTLTNELSPEAVKSALMYMYGGELQTHPSRHHCASTSSQDYSQTTRFAGFYADLVKVAELFEMDSLRDLLLETTGRANGIVGELRADARFISERSANLISLGLEFGLFSDVKFVVDNGVVRAQKFLLCARCDVMRAMFSNAFRESCLSEVTLPGVSAEALRLFIMYLMVDSVSYSGEGSYHMIDFMEALELANRMCVSRLVTVIEDEIVAELERLDAKQELNVEEVLMILEPAQMCNAQQLVAWCFHHSCCNYSRVCDQCGKLFKALSPSNQDYIVKHRWPPLWYLKEHDWHEKMVREGLRAAETAANKLLKRTRTSGCLCFSTRTSAPMQHNSI